jgi:hypothetical protein
VAFELARWLAAPGRWVGMFDILNYTLRRMITASSLYSRLVLENECQPMNW